MEKLLQEDQTESKTGRATESTLSNLAHAEAVLGSEAEGSPSGIVEFWGQYIQKHKAEAEKKCSSASGSQKRTCTPKN